MSSNRTSRGLILSVLALGAAALLAGCEETGSMDNARAYAAIPPSTEQLMAEKGSTKDAPMLIRAYKKEAELEIWKRKPDGQYVYLKTFPMCRWSGQLGPKTTEGDRQVPEGFYTITPGQMNPNSHYYLSFNVGYPNAYDRANGHTGGSIMVHGICSSAGCFSMTDKQIEEIYAIARESFAGGQRAIQMQSFPFKMTAENLAKLRLDPNMPFWRELKKGADYFEVTKTETPVGVCNRHYVFGASPKSGRFDAESACPPLDENADVKAQLARKEATDNAEVAALTSKGVQPVRLIYADGGQNAEFAHRFVEVSRPDALAQGPTEIVLDQPKSKSVAVQIAAAKAQSKALLARGNVITSNVTVAEGSAKQIPASAPVSVAQAVVPATFNAAPSAYASTPPADEATGGIFGKWLSPDRAAKPETAPVVQAAATVSTQPAPAHRGASRPGIKPAPSTTVVATATQTQVAQAPATAVPASASDGQGGFFKSWLNLGGTAKTDATPAAQAAAVPVATSPAHPVAKAPRMTGNAKALPKEITGDKTASLPAGTLALAPGVN